MATCHGCNGKGWVETASGMLVHICPVCLGVGQLSGIIISSTSTVAPTGLNRCPCCGGFKLNLAPTSSPLPCDPVI